MDGSSDHGSMFSNVNQYIYIYILVYIYSIYIIIYDMIYYIYPLSPHGWFK